jgi:hypothetical protein
MEIPLRRVLWTRVQFPPPPKISGNGLPYGPSRSEGKVLARWCKDNSLHLQKFQGMDCLTGRQGPKAKSLHVGARTIPSTSTSLFSATSTLHRVIRQNERLPFWGSFLKSLWYSSASFSIIRAFAPVGVDPNAQSDQHGRKYE